MDTTALVTPKALDGQIASGDAPLLVDIRSDESRRAFALETRAAARQLHLPYRRLLAELEAGPRELPPPELAGRVVVICDRGETSMDAARALRAAGYLAFSLAGGVRAWSQLVVPIVVPGSEWLGGGAELIQFRRLGKGCLGYALVAGDDALAVDAGRDIEMLLAQVAERGARITRAADTHLHADHVSGGPAVARESGSAYCLPAADAKGARTRFEPVRHGDVWSVGRIAVRAIHTPGHTEGSTSYLVGDRFLLTGDTLFVRGIGRPDLSGQGARLARLLHRTLTDTLAALPDSVEILPAHIGAADEVSADGVAAARLGDVRRSTLSRLPADADEFAGAVLGALPEQPPNFERIRVANRLGRTDEDPAELEFGPNRCAVSVH